MMITRVIAQGMRRNELIDALVRDEWELLRLSNVDQAAAAVRRVQKLAERFEADAEAGGSAGPVAAAIALEIRNALREEE